MTFQKANLLGFLHAYWGSSENYFYQIIRNHIENLLKTILTYLLWDWFCDPLNTKHIKQVGRWEHLTAETCQFVSISKIHNCKSKYFRSKAALYIWIRSWPLYRDSPNFPCFLHCLTLIDQELFISSKVSVIYIYYTCTHCGKNWNCQNLDFSKTLQSNKRESK